jgi:hypothetical protein
VAQSLSSSSTRNPWKAPSHDNIIILVWDIIVFKLATVAQKLPAAGRDTDIIQVFRHSLTRDSEKDSDSGSRSGRTRAAGSGPAFYSPTRSPAWQSHSVALAAGRGGPALGHWPGPVTWQCRWGRSPRRRPGRRCPGGPGRLGPLMIFSARAVGLVTVTRTRRRPLPLH